MLYHNVESQNYGYPCCSVAHSCPTLGDSTVCSTPGLLVLHHLLEPVQICIYGVSDAVHLILCHPLLLLPSMSPSIRVFLMSAHCIRWPKYWSVIFSISPSNEYSGMICFRIDWFDLFVVQETLKSLLQHHSSKGSILQCPATSWFNSHIHTWLLEKPQLWLDGPL